MRYLISVLDTQTGQATTGEMQAIDQFNAALQTEGHWVMAAGLQHPSQAFVVAPQANALMAKPGPHTETERYTSGFWIIEAENDESALDLAQRAAVACNRDVEVRGFL